jgi:hypothetical protein
VPGLKPVHNLRDRLGSRALLASLALPLVVLAGCSGNTTAPQNVTQTSAELHASVSCGSGENCSMYFKWGLADNGVSGLNNQTPTTNPPVAGPFSNADAHWPINNLQPGTTYGYQVCGNAQPGQTFFCAGNDGLNNTMTEFTTLPNCTTTLSPGANIATAVQNAAAGAVVCLNAGTYNTSPTIASTNGTSSSPVTLTSANPANPATINGRFVTNGTAKWLVISHLKFTWSSGTDDTIALTGDNITLTRNDVSGSDGTICITTTAWNGANATNIKIDHNKIHNCGDINDPNPDINAGDRAHAQGVYTNPGTSNLRVTNNWCWHVAARCYQERAGANDVWSHNVADYDNWGYHFGDLSPHDNSMTWNISGTHEYHYQSSGFYYGGDLSVFGGGTNETFSNNCWQGEINPSPLPSNVTASNNVTGQPDFKDPVNGDFRLNLNSPCGTGGYGLPTGNTPGP